MINVDKVHKVKSITDKSERNNK